MSNDDGSFEPVLNRLVRSIEELDDQSATKKRLANELCREFGRPPRYPEVEQPKATSLAALGRDVFYGRPLATVIKEYLELRGPSNRGGLGAATVNEIYDALVSGGFKFETKDEANAKRGLRIALAKNTAAFHKVGNAYGLTDWYPSARTRSRGGISTDPSGNGASQTSDVEEAEGGEPEASQTNSGPVGQH